MQDLLVWVRYYASPVSPTPDCITGKFREFISGNSSRSQDIFRQMYDMKLGFDVQWSAYSRLVLQWSRCVLKSPWLCRLGDASYVMCTALYMMVLYDRARVGPTTKTSDEISIICLFRLILQANTLFYFVLWYSSSFEFRCSFHIFFKWLLNLWKCDDLLRNSFVHLRSNVYCEDYML